MDLFRKVTDSHHCVLFISCHPSQTKQNIPFNLARKICTIVDEENSKEKRMEDLKRTLTRQGYPPKLIDASINKAKKIPKQQLCQQKRRNEDNEWLLVFVSTYNPRNPDIFKVIKETLHLSNASPEMKKALEGTKLINSRRQPPNPERTLTRAKFNFPAQVQTGNTTKTKSCNNGKCGICQVSFERNEVIFNNNSTPFKIKETDDVLCWTIHYVIECAGCNKQYIGETGNLRDQVRVHRQDIFTPYLRNQYVSHQIAHCAIGKRTPFKITSILPINCNDRIYREEMERSLIRKFKPELNRERWALKWKRDCGETKQTAHSVSDVILEARPK